MSSALEVQGIARNRQDTFPYSAMRLLGCFQIINGILVFILGVVDLILTMTSYNDDKVTYGSNYDVIVSLTVASAPLWCGMWFAITGGIGACISRDRAHTLQFFKIGFLVLNVLCCALFGPICSILAAFIGFSRHSLDSEDLQWLLHLIVSFLAILEVIIATVSAAVTCCCAPLRSTQIHVIVNPQSIQGGANPFVVDKESSGISAREVGSGKSRTDPDHDPTDHSKNNNLRDTPLKNNYYRDTNNLRQSNATNPRDLDADQSPFVEPFSSRTRQPRVEMTEPIIDGFGDSSSGYPKLKKWALPHW